MNLCQLGVDDGATIEVGPTETDAKAVRLARDDTEGLKCSMTGGSARCGGPTMVQQAGAMMAQVDPHQSLT